MKVSVNIRKLTYSIRMHVVVKQHSGGDIIEFRYFRYFYVASESDYTLERERWTPDYRTIEQGVFLRSSKYFLRMFFFKLEICLKYD